MCFDVQLVVIYLLDDVKLYKLENACLPKSPWWPHQNTYEIQTVRRKPQP